MVIINFNNCFAETAYSINYQDNSDYFAHEAS